VTADLQSGNWVASRKGCLETKSCDIVRIVKIHADKIEGGPPHALNKRDIRIIIKTVPQEWTKEIKEVRIANSLERISHTFFSRCDGCLTIYSRNRTKERALETVLSALAAISIGVDRGLRGRPRAVRNRLAKITAPYKQQLLPLITSPTWTEAQISLEGFRELKFPFVPNDIE
jgi:hypothetical protein